ncbi:MAG: Spore germination protein YndE [Pelotomaculum sp. PtaU1.Bin065]|nr:MAG: Spore germination protein YndE [Pelotomaculum sp. PtaU1.Bin065]
MLEGGKIDSKQAIFLMVSLVLPTAFIFVAAGTARLSKQDGWLSILLAVPVGLLIAWLVVNLSLRFPGKTIFQFPEAILGKWPGKAVALLYIWYYINTNSTITQQYSYFLASAYMPETPRIVFELLIVIIAAYAVRNGLEVFTRVNQIVLPIILISVVILIILAAREMDLKKLLPVFIDTGTVPIIKGAVSPALWMGEIVTMAVLIPYLNKAKEAYRIAVTASLISAFFMLAVFVAVIAIFNPTVTVGWYYPALNGFRMIHLANFLERMDPFVMVIWVAGVLIKISIFYWAAVLGSAQWLGLKDYRPLILPVGAILLALSAMKHDSIMDLFSTLGASGPPILALHEVVLPLFLLVAAAIRGKRVKQN